MRILKIFNISCNHKPVLGGLNRFGVFTLGHIESHGCTCKSHWRTAGRKKKHPGLYTGDLLHVSGWHTLFGWPHNNEDAPTKTITARQGYHLPRNPATPFSPNKSCAELLLAQPQPWHCSYIRIYYQ